MVEEEEKDNDNDDDDEGIKRARERIERVDPGADGSWWIRYDTIRKSMRRGIDETKERKGK